MRAGLRCPIASISDFIHIDKVMDSSRWLRLEHLYHQVAHREALLTEYILAIRRDARDTAPPDWLERVQRIHGVTLITESPGRARVSVDDEAYQRLVDAIGSFCHVEPLIPHHVLGQGGAP